MKKKFTNAATTSTTISLSASKTIVISSKKTKTEKPRAKSPTTMIKQDQSNTEADENSEKNQILIQLPKIRLCFITWGSLLFSPFQSLASVQYVLIIKSDYLFDSQKKCNKLNFLGLEGET